MYVPYMPLRDPDITAYRITPEEAEAEGLSAEEVASQNAEMQLLANANNCIRRMAMGRLIVTLARIWSTRGRHSVIDLRRTTGGTVTPWTFLMLDLSGILSREALLRTAGSDGPLTDVEHLALSGMARAARERFEESFNDEPDPTIGVDLRYMDWLDENIYAVIDTHPALRYVLDIPVLRDNPAAWPGGKYWCTIDAIRRVAYYAHANRDDTGYYRYTPEEWRMTLDGTLMRPLTIAMYDELLTAHAYAREPRIPFLDRMRQDRALGPKEFETIYALGPRAFMPDGSIRRSTRDSYFERSEERRRGRARQQHEYREAGKGKKPPRRRAPGALPPVDPTQPRTKRKPRRGKPTGA